MSDIARLLEAIGADKGWFLLERPGDKGWWVKATRRAELERHAEAMLYPGDVTVNVVPHLRVEDIYHGDSRVLWTRVEDGAALRALRRFEPGPSLVIREGRSSRHVALWALRRALGPSDVVRANKRIAHALGPGARKKFCDVDFRLPLPGAVLRYRRKVPAVAHVVGGHGERMGAGQITKRLRDAPDPTEAWLRKIGRLP